MDSISTCKYIYIPLNTINHKGPFFPYPQFYSFTKISRAHVNKSLTYELEPYRTQDIERWKKDAEVTHGMFKGVP